MGIFSKMKQAWKEANTATKINFILDIICGIGANTVANVCMKRIAPDMKRGERICAGIMMSGLGMAAGQVATNAYNPFCESAGKIIDAINKKPETENKEEE